MNAFIDWLSNTFIPTTQNAVNSVVGFVNNILWGDGQILIYLLLFAGVWFSWKLKLVQILDFKHMFSIMRKSTKDDESGISSFQALCTSLSARVGTGNLAGVAVAISLGGSGAIFWMWVIAVLGMATGYAKYVILRGSIEVVRPITFNKAYKIKRSRYCLRCAYFLAMALFLVPSKLIQSPTP